MNHRYTEEERFWSKVEKQDGGCWNWTGTLYRGYAQFNVCISSKRWKTVKAYRWVWEKVNGPIPQGMQIDHLCRNRACVNPDHLEVVTSRENTMRGMSPNIITHRTGICKNGHRIEGDNVCVKPNGMRYCRACTNARWNRWYAARKARSTQS